MLSQALGRFFSATTRVRGESYFRSGRVTLHDSNDVSVRSSVAGSTRYEVQLDREPPAIVVGQCTCPYALDGHACKHLWATILAADASGFLTGGGAPTSFEMVYADEDPGDDIEDDPYGGIRPEPFRSFAGRATWTAPPMARREPTWRDLLAGLTESHRSARPSRLRTGREVVFVIDAPLSGAGGALVVELGWRDRKANGEWGMPRTKSWLHDELAGAATPEDEVALELLAGVADSGPYQYDRGPFSMRQNVIRVPHALVGLIAPAVCATGHARVRARTMGPVSPEPLRWDDGPAWELVLTLQPEEGGGFGLDYEVRRAGERLPRGDVLAITRTHVITSSCLARVECHGAFAWLALLQRNGRLKVPAGDEYALVGEVLARAGTVPLELPPGLDLEERATAPRPLVHLRAPEGERASALLAAEVAFDYEGVVVPASAEALRLLAGRTIVRRDRQAEAAAMRDLAAAGLRDRPGGEGLAVPASRLAEAVRHLIAAGWHVEAEGRPHRIATGTRARITSGIDWFDLDGVVEFGEQSVSVAAVVDALARGARAVTLDDGSVGLLPDDWLAQVGEWAGLGERHGDALRFRRGQAALLDALVAAAPAVDADAAFERARQALCEFSGIAAADPPPGFVGTLRPYQREGLGWIRFLEGFGFGGCLADDMGLGKTVQVLAALAGRRAAGHATAPSLIVVPRSLVFNWMREAARFTPGLQVADRTASGRDRTRESLRDADLVIATYGTLRRDAVDLSATEFDYLVLDEAHAIKNADSQTAKAVRLLRGRHRLALTGTPVQNHLGELWSLFDFLNPGLLGRSRTFAALANHSGTDAGARALLGRAVRPYVLRRTKQEVAGDLPERTEDTIVCRMGREERAFYDDLREHYRRAVGERIARQGWARSQVFVLDALLRLRQAACHPGLVEPARRDEASAKLDVLLTHLAELRAEGHKAIVFSQFVQLLTLVRAVLDREGVAYEYLDGKTRDRDRRVDRFQQDEACGLFLVSLKAGGLGLNLTAAEYVFLLDPWWNPAVEAQAIDRAHRIGQARHVFAYRLIAADTIDEKVIELQARKRELADGILGGEAGGLKALTREDLELLLS